jgi:hypothetical protein
MPSGISSKGIPLMNRTQRVAGAHRSATLLADNVNKIQPAGFDRR